MADLRVLVDVITKGDRHLAGLSQNLDQADRKAKGLQGQLDRIPGPVKAIGGAFLAAGIVDVLGDAATEATGLAEATSKANVVFGEGAPEIAAWAESMAQVGVSKRAATEAAGTYGNLFQAFGIGQGKAQEMSTSLVELAADMASFNNTSIDDALIALRSGLSGETEPLKRYGVALNDARLRQIALEQGIYDGVGALNAQQKAQAAYTLILEDTTLAQGDAIRTGDQLAGSQRRVQAEIDNAMASIGQEVASIQLGAIRVAEFLNQEFNPWEPVAERWNEDFNDVLGVVDDFVGGHKERIDYMPTDAQLAASAAARNVYTELEKGGPVIAAEAGKIAGMLPSEIQAQVDNIRQAGADSVDAFAAGILERQQAPADAWDQAMNAADTALSRAEQIAEIHARLSSEEFVEGINSELPEVRSAFRAYALTAQEQLGNLGADAFTWGSGLGWSMAGGIYQTIPVVRTAAGELANAVRGQIGIRSEPHDRDSALRGITLWGGNIVDTMAEGITHRLSVAERASQRLSGALAPELSTGSGGISLNAAAGPAAAGGVHTHIHLTYSGETPTDERSLIHLLQEVAPFVDGRLRVGD